MGLAFILALITGVSIVVVGLGFNMWAPLFYGVIAGAFVGNLELGLYVGSICALMAIGFYTYGGATMPDFSIGAIFGVFMASQTITKDAGPAEMRLAVDTALPIVAAIALLMSLFDILGRASTTVFQHGGDAALAKRNVASFQRWHLAGTIPWALSRAIPVFIGMLFIHQYEVLAGNIEKLEWLQQGLAVIGASLPAVGFALLISYMDIGTYWPYMLVGFGVYVPLAFLEKTSESLGQASSSIKEVAEKLPEVAEKLEIPDLNYIFPSPIVLLAIIGVAAAGLYMKGKKDLDKGGI